MSKLYNLARVTTATTGTGTMTLSTAVSGFLTFANAGAVDGDVVSYAIRDGVNSEIGTGTYNSAGPTLTRTNILRSTNSNTAISLSGTAQVFITPNTADFSTLAPLIAPSLTGPVLINTTRPTAQLAVANVWTNNDARYRKLITLAARTAQFRLSDQPPAEHIVGALMISDGNIVFPSPGARVIADMSSSTLANRFAFQTSVTNGNSIVTVIGNGTSLTAQVNLETDPLLANGNVFTLVQVGTEGRLQTTVRGSGTQGPMTFFTGATEKMRLDASGNLGIGLTPSGLFTLEVAGMLGLNVSTPEFWMINTAAGTDARDWRLIVSGSQMWFDICNDAATVQGCQWFTATRSVNTITNLNWSVNTSGTHTWAVQGAEKMRLDASGNLGIGSTPSGTYKLEVTGNTLVTGTTTMLNIVTLQYATPVFQFLNTSGATDEKYFRIFALGNALDFDIVNDAYSAQGTVWLTVTRSANTITNINHNVATSGTHTWQINASEKWRIDASGNLQASATGQRIRFDGSTATVANRLAFQSSVVNGNTTFHVIPNGIATAVSIVLETDSALTNGNTFTVLQSGTESRLQSNIRGTGTQGFMTFVIGGAEKMRLDASGNLVIGATSAAITGLDVVGGICARGGSSGSYSAATSNPTVSIFFDVANNAGNIFSIAAGVAWKPLQIQFNTLLLQAASAPVNAIFIDASGNVAIGTTTTSSGVLNINGGLTTNSSINMTAVNAGIEIGSQTTANTPFIDFHSSGGVEDYSARIIATGGTSGTIGAGSLNVNAKVFNVCADTATTAGGAAGHFLQFGTTAGFGIYFGSGAPTISAAKGSLYLRSDGILGASFYINNSGSTGWQAEG